MRSGGRAATALLAALALVATACGSSTSDSAPSAAAPEAAESTSETLDRAESTDATDPAGSTDATDATDAGFVLPEPTTQGITDDEIHVGVMYLDLGVADTVGAPLEVDETTVGYDVFFDDLNARGGIAGRQIVPHYYQFSPIDPTNQLQACIAATQDDEVFLVVVTVGYDGESVLCLTEQNHTLTISLDSVPESYFARAPGLLFSVAANDTRMARAWARLLHDAGELDGHTIGIVRESTLSVSRYVEDGLIPELEDLGYEIAADVILPCEGLYSPCSQHENGVELMKSAGVDAVFSALTATANPAFLSASIDAGFDPQWFVNGLNVAATLTGILTADPARTEAYDGALAVAAGSNRRMRAEDPATTPVDFSFECADRYAELTGTLFEWDPFAENNDAWGLMVGQCGLVALIEQIGSTIPAGELDSASFSQAIQQVTELPTTPEDAPPSGWGPGRFDAVNYATILRFDAACACWLSYDGELHSIADIE